MTLQTILNRYGNKIEEDLRSIIIGNDIPLYNMMAYHMGWLNEQGDEVNVDTYGNRIYPSLCLLACEAFGGSTENALSSASSIELIKNFIQIHLDIQDGIPYRNNRPTLWWVWGPAQSINAGDGMHALARLALLSQKEKGFPAEQVLRSVSVLDNTCLTICEGEYLDLTYRERVDVSQDAYLKMVEMKSASFMVCALRLGALAASASDNQIEAIARFGLKLGVAAQIKDDINDLWAIHDESFLAGEVLNKKKSLPIIFALKNATGLEKRALGDVYFKRVMEPEDIKKLIAVLEALGAKEFSEQMIDNLYKQALKELSEAEIRPDFIGDFNKVADSFSVT